MWTDSDADAGEFWAWSQQLKDDSPDQRELAEAAMTVYLGREFAFQGRQSLDLSALMGLEEEGLDPVGYNVVASVTDTMAGHLLRNKVRPMFVTQRGTPQQQADAQGMQRGIEGEFHNAGIYSARGVDVCYRGLILNGGGVKVLVDHENHCLDFQTVWPHEFYVPRLEAYRGCVRQLMHEYDVDRAVLKRRYPEHADEIDQAPFSNDAAGMINQTTISDRVTVREAWAVPTLDPDLHEDHDGVHVIAIPGAELMRRPYTGRMPPVSFFLPMRVQGEYWSRGYPERLAGAQCKLNEYNERIDRILWLHARPLLVTWARAGLRPEHITNDIATILRSKVPPSQALWQMTPQAVPRELVERVVAIIDWAEKQAGVSDLSINATKPAGIEHAPALRHLQDQEAVRHTMVFRAWEDFHVNLAKITVDALRELAETAPSYETAFHNNQELVRVKWSDVDLGKGKYHLTCYPSNLLPTTPTALISLLGEMIQYGMISPQEALSRFDNPDVKDLLGDQSAAAENIERLLREAAASEETPVPHPYMDLQLLQMKAKERLNRLEADGANEEIIERFVKLFEFAREQELKSAAETANAGATGGNAIAPGMAAPPEAPAGPPAGAPPLA